MPGCNKLVHVEGQVGMVKSRARVQTYESIGKVHHEQRSHQRYDSVEVWHCCCNEESLSWTRQSVTVPCISFPLDTYNNPVHRSQTIPKDLALLFNDRWELEDGLENFKVDSLHADIEVHD